jgi:hypothetical protein
MDCLLCAICIRFRARLLTLAIIGYDAVADSILGLSVPDAIAIGTILAAVLAARFGGRQGEVAKQEAIRSAAAVSIGGTLVDAMQFGDYVKTLEKLAIAMATHADALNRQHEIKHTNALEELAAKIDQALDQKRR